LDDIVDEPAMSDFRRFLGDTSAMAKSRCLWLEDHNSLEIQEAEVLDVARELNSVVVVFGWFGSEIKFWGQKPPKTAIGGDVLPSPSASPPVYKAEIRAGCCRHAYGASLIRWYIMQWISNIKVYV